MRLVRVDRDMPVVAGRGRKSSMPERTFNGEAQRICLVAVDHRREAILHFAVPVRRVSDCVPKTYRVSRGVRTILGALRDPRKRILLRRIVVDIHLHAKPNGYVRCDLVQLLAAVVERQLSA